MTLHSLLLALAALWWGLAVLLLLASFLAALLFPHLPWQRPGGASLRPLTAIVPVKYWNDHFAVDQQSLFAQDYPDLEIIVAAAEPRSDALDAVHQIQREFSAIASRIVQSDGVHAASPKLDTLWPGIEAARHDLILTKDFNIRLAPGDVENLVRHHGPGVGLVSTISITTAPQSFAAWVETSIINGYHGRMLMLASALGLGVGCGKVMLFRRTDLERAGGLPRLAWAIGEDEAMQQAFAGIGLRTVLSGRTSQQILGRRSLREIWQRQLRWMLIWRFQTPAVFVGDFFISALPVSAAAAIAATLAGLTPVAAFAATLGFWFLLESLLCLIKGWPLSLWSAPAFLGREILGLAVHLKALTTHEVAWGGAVRRAGRKRSP